MASIERNKITLVMDRAYSKEVVTALKNMGILDLHIETGRTLQLDKPSLGNIIMGRPTLDEEQAGIYTFLVSREQSRETLEHLAGLLQLDRPGRGTIFSRRVTLRHSSPAHRPNNCKLGPERVRIPEAQLMGLYCTVQKGQGNTLGQVGLITGTAVPVITFGSGTGLRNRLGLWRIMIPADKEVALLVLDQDEAESVMDMMVDAGDLDQPGKGFIYTFPIECGLLNTRFHLGHTSQAASVEQIVTAIDEIKGSTTWRRKSLDLGRSGKPQRRFLTELVELTLICNEGCAEPLTRHAISAGATGATIRRLRHLALDEGNTAYSPAREISVMNVAPEQVETIISALQTQDLDSPGVCAVIHTSPAPRAYTYLGI